MRRVVRGSDGPASASFGPRNLGAAVAFALAVGCGGGSDLADPGEETGPCNDSRCFAGLLCLSNLCVDPSSAAGTSASAGVTAAGSNSGSGMRSGLFLLAVDTVIAPGLPLQFIATVDDQGDTIAVDLESLALDPGSTTTPRNVLDPVLPVDPVMYLPDGSFTLSLATLDVPGRANPITGSAITLSPLNLSGSFTIDDLFCGQASGMFTDPITSSLDGSTFAATRIDSTMNLPLEFRVACP